MYGALARPLLYRATQALLAPSGQTHLLALLHARLEASAALARARQRGAPRLLDVGCGPRSMLRALGHDAVALDLCADYVRALPGRGSAAVGSACRLPFAAHTFDLVMSCGLLHHLRDDEACHSLAEMQRVTRADGELVIIDAVLPERAWQRPLAYAIRRLDRGRFMRTGARLHALLQAATPRWSITRATYAATGLECVVAVNGAGHSIEEPHACL